MTSTFSTIGFPSLRIQVTEKLADLFTQPTKYAVWWLYVNVSLESSKWHSKWIKNGLSCFYGINTCCYVDGAFLFVTFFKLQFLYLLSSLLNEFSCLDGIGIATTQKGIFLYYVNPTNLTFLSFTLWLWTLNSKHWYQLRFFTLANNLYLELFKKLWLGLMHFFAKVINLTWRKQLLATFFSVAQTIDY